MRTGVPPVNVRYRNGLGLAIPDKRQIEALRRAVRYLLAIERVDAKKQPLRLTRDQLDQLKERKRTEEAAAESCLRDLYTAVWLPRVENGEIHVERVERGGCPLQATGIHERIMELLTSVGTLRVHGSVTSRKVAERVKLGEPVPPACAAEPSNAAGRQGGTPVQGLKASEILESFFRDIAPPRLESSAVLRKAIARGVTEGTFAYTSLPATTLAAQVGAAATPGAPPTVPGIPVSAPGTPMQPTAPGGVPTLTPGAPVAGQQSTVRLAFMATRDQIFKAFPAIANLADKSDGGKVKVSVEGTSTEGFDPSWLRNAIDEPLDEVDIERVTEE